jgi:hypothetical protein
MKTDEFKKELDLILEDFDAAVTNSLAPMWMIKDACVRRNLAISELIAKISSIHS